MSYESPIKLVTDLSYKFIEDQERNIVKAVCSYDIDISKDELFKLLYDDRKQYDKGYSDGYAKAKEDIVQCKECAYGVKTRDEDIFLCAQYDNTHYDTFYCAEGAKKDEVEE